MVIVLHENSYKISSLVWANQSQCMLQFRNFAYALAFLKN